MTTLRSALYRQFLNKIVRMGLGSFYSIPSPKGKISKNYFFEEKKGKRAWFHAASVGELEGLWPLVWKWAEMSGELIITAFSNSAQKSLQVLEKEIRQRHSNQLVYIGHSPFEGQWHLAMDALNPNFFVTLRYEAWPELWMSLAERCIPIIIIGARYRTSIRVAREICKLMLGRLPNLTLLPYSEEHTVTLSKRFPGARIKSIKDLRWDRVEMRRSRGNPRARELADCFLKLPRPWGVLGSVWVEDFFHWRGNFGLGGTRWVVPHDIRPNSIMNIENILRKEGIRFTKSSNINLLSMNEDAVGKCDNILVDENGILTELYSFADWAYVGGGFGRGIHSVIEPGIYGIPVSVGPKGTDLFEEVAELERREQLSIVENSTDILKWLDTVGLKSQKFRSEWKRAARERLGATEEVIEIIKSI